MWNLNIQCCDLEAVSRFVIVGQRNHWPEARSLVIIIDAPTHTLIYIMAFHDSKCGMIEWISVPVWCDLESAEHMHSQCFVLWTSVGSLYYGQYDCITWHWHCRLMYVSLCCPQCLQVCCLPCGLLTYMTTRCLTDSYLGNQSLQIYISSVLINRTSSRTRTTLDECTCLIEISNGQPLLPQKKC